MPEPKWTDEHSRRVIEQALKLWIEPEVKRRQERGEIPKPYPLTAAQMIFDPDAEVVSVRLNAEVRAVGELPIEGPVKKGEILEIDPMKVTNLHLTDVDPNAGHLTLYAFGPRWLVSFDFRRNAARIAEHLDAACEFLTAAKNALDQGHSRALAENLFSAVELMAKSFLLTLPGREIIESKKHPTIGGRFNWWGGKLKNTDPTFVELLNELSDIRGLARYLQGKFRLDQGKAADMIETAERMLEAAKEDAPTTKSIDP